MKKKLALLGAVALVGTVLVPTNASADDPAFACTDGGGVYVIVIGQGSGCVHNPSTGVDALYKAGFTVGFSGSGLINQIGGSPNPAPEVPPFESHWSYWHAAPNGALGSHTGFNGWNYSQEGAGTRRPTTGGIEVWWFGNGMAGYPTVAVPSRVINPPAPPPTTTAPAPERPTATITQPTQGATTEQPEETESPEVTPSESGSPSTTPTLSNSPSASVSDAPVITENPGSAPIGWIALGVAGVAGVVSLAWFKLRGKAKS